MTTIDILRKRPLPAAHCAAATLGCAHLALDLGHVPGRTLRLGQRHDLVRAPHLNDRLAA
jgi:hypothetical protein